MQSKRVIQIVVVVLLLAAVIYGIWWYFANWDQVEAQALAVQAAAATVLAGWQCVAGVHRS